MTHLPDHLLGLYALDPAAVPNRQALEQHLDACDECRANFEAIRAFDDQLRDPAVWEGGSSKNEAAGAKEIRRFAETLAREDEEAARLLAPYEETPAARFVWDDLPSDPAYQTAGVVRLLCKRANAMCEREPLYALALAEAASAIADKLRKSDYPRDVVHQWRGDALKEQANALRFLGRLPAALDALDRAEAEYGNLRHPGIGMVAVFFVRATVLFEQDDYEAADALAERAALAARHLGDEERALNARHLQAQILFEKGAFKAAAEVFAAILKDGEERGMPLRVARESVTLANCYIEMGKSALARDHIARAQAIFTSLRLKAELTRAEWARARCDLMDGKIAAALTGLRSCIRSFTDLDMLTDAGLVAIDAAEVLFATGRTSEIPPLLAGIVKTFTEAGKLTGALSAFAYLRTAAATATLTSAAVAHARHFVARADRHPEMLFVPPPGESL
jgi:tetratricopeptide (TPR) repeat protein